MNPNPIDYTSAFADLPMPGDAFMAGLKNATGLRDMQDKRAQAEAAAAQKQQQQQQQQLVIEQLIANRHAGADDYANAMKLVPGMHEQLKEAWTIKNSAQQQTHLSDLSQWGAAIQNGKPEFAVDAMLARAQALENSFGAPTRDSQALRAQAQVIKEQPEFGNFMIKAMLAAHPEGSKVVESLVKIGDAARADKEAPFDLAKKKAEAEKAEAEAKVARGTVPALIAKPVLENKDVESKIIERAARLGLDQDRLTSEIQLKVSEFKQKAGALPDSAVKIVNESASAAVAADQSAIQTLDLASKFQTLGGGNGGFSSTKEAFNKLTGSQDGATALRQEYTRLRSSAAIKTLPPGPATDKDIELALKGFPPENAGSAYIASFLRGQAKLQQREAVFETAKAEWVNAVGHLGKPKTDIEVDGVKLPAGATFIDFARQFLKRKTDELGAKHASEMVQSRSYMRFAQPESPQQGGASGDW